MVLLADKMPNLASPTASNVTAPRHERDACQADDCSTITRQKSFVDVLSHFQDEKVGDGYARAELPTREDIREHSEPEVHGRTYQMSADNSYLGCRHPHW